MSRRSPRSPAASRPDDPAASTPTDHPATGTPATHDAPTDDAGELDRPAGSPTRREVADDTERPEAAGDAALLGAYALGALTPDQRADVEERLAASPALREELRRLIPVAALLHEANDPPPSPAADPNPSQGQPPDTFANPHDGHDRAPVDDPARPLDDPSPSPEPALDEFVDDAGESSVRVEAAPGSLSSRQARRPARPAREPAAARPRPQRASTIVAGWPLSWLGAGLATLVAVGAVLWALAMVDRLDARRDEVAALQAEVRALRARGDAAVVALVPGESGPAGADGVVVVARSEGALIVRVAGLPASPEGRVYQIWFQDEADGVWIVGPVFRVGEAGTALVELPAAAPAFTRLAVSDEPSPGGEAPTGAFLLQGTVAGGAPGTPSP